MKFPWNSSEKASPPSSLDHEHIQNYPGATEVPYQPDGYDEDLHAPCPPHTTGRKLVARIDWRLMPVLIVLYLLAFIDRINISNANVLGLSKELGLVGDQYNTALVIFFVPYVLFAAPVAFVGKRLGPARVLPVLMFVFGSMTLLSAAVKNFGGMMATRWILGEH